MTACPQSDSAQILQFMSKREARSSCSVVQDNLVAGLVGFCVGAGVTFAGSKRIQQLLSRKSAIRAPKSLKHRDFQLEPALYQGKVEVGSLPLCKVLLADDSQYAGWLVLVPQQNGLTEITDLSAQAQRVLWEEVAAVMRVIERVFQPDKLNQAAIGNMVAQLHIHLTGRRRTDPAWPNVHLGTRPAVPYQSAELQEVMEKVLCALKEEGLQLEPIDLEADC